MRALLYCTKSAPYLIKTINYNYLLSNKYDTQIHNMFGNYYNGKIVAEIEFEVEKIVYKETTKNNYSFGTETLTPEELLDKSCLTISELCKYIGESPNWTKGDYGYAIKITHLILNWRPREINEYYIKKRIRNKKYFVDVTKAPQNMCYAYNRYGTRYVLISVKPEWLAKILNREKTIEVRKKVLKEMLNDKQIMG